MKAADQRLDELVAKMNTASGMEKMTATAAVVTEMVSQRRTMREGMMNMRDVPRVAATRRRVIT